MWKVGLLVVAVLHSLQICESIDHCLEGNHLILPNTGKRGTLCKRTADVSICDRYIDIGRDKWYKVLGHDDTVPRKMAEGSAKMFHCGTDYPIYLPNGSHPTTSGTVVTRNACMLAGSNICKEQYPVQIMHCGTFFLYNLSRPNSCDIAYCFGDNMECSKPDPCEEANRLILHVSGDRSTRCRDKSLRHCDSKLQQNWYRPMMGSADVKMATSCVERDSCGTESPIWLNGLEPSLADKTVDMKACVNFGRTSMCSCDEEIDIQVRNCSSYLVYNLNATSKCPQRYCFGNSGNCDVAATAKEYPVWQIVLILLAAIAVLAVILCVFTYILIKKIFRSPSKVQSINSTKENDVCTNVQMVLKPKY
uniref:Uncharacterized protein LOC111107801 isoform X1 n=1 Tax=Crassostrea virginica TaxID=6565 RepID=A0A8B8B634_CRAVI|nr:uncharacterized protein LOC111107801 isoform X1 [Crassostrea virginica]